MADNVTMRHEGEERLARELAAQGVQATPGYQIFGNGGPRDLDAMKTKLREMGYDGVVTMRVVDREQEIEAVPGTFDAYWGYWGPGYWAAYPGYWAGSPGYLYTETIYQLETAAYSLSDGRLLWSALTETVDPANPGEMVEETSEIIAGQLTRRGLAG